MHDLDLILTLTGGFAAALLFGYGTHRIGLSPIVGYLLAGIAIGPHTPGFVANRELAEQLSEIGVILLMFGVGLHFQLRDLLAVRRVALPGAIIQSLAATIMGCAVTVSCGWSWQAGLVFGLALSVASTVVLLRVLSDNNDLHTPTGHIAVGWLIVEDLFTVLILVLLPVVFSAGAEEGAHSIVLGLALALLKIGLLIGFIILMGRRLIPWLLERVAVTRSRELFTLTVLVLALGIAVGAAKIFGVSMALGAFMAGMVVSQSDFSSRAAAEALPMRDAFAVIFFVSVGMLFDPGYLLEAPGLVAATLGIVLLGKPLVAFVIVFLLGYPLRIGFTVAIALAQIGEFSFILAVQGAELGILPANAMNTLVAAAIVSIGLNPLLYRMIDWLEARAKKVSGIARLLDARSHVSVDAALATIDSGENYLTRAIVVGYGPVGSTIVRLLRENDIQPTVIELNLDTVHRLRGEGIRAFYGDAAHRETLTQAGAARSVALILSAPFFPGCAEAIRLAREENPRIRVFARAPYLRDLKALREAGAEFVFSGEGEVTISMTEFILRQLGASAEQIDRERSRIRTELLGNAQTIDAFLADSQPPDPQPGANS